MLRVHDITIILLMTLLTGCGSNVGLSGKVVFSDDKSPVPLGTVELISESGTFSARAEIKPDGTFVVGSLKEKDGLPPGKYRISVYAIKTTAVGTKRNSDGMEMIDSVSEYLVEPKFGNPDTSEITIDIASTVRNYEIVVDRAPPGMKVRW